MRLERRGDLEDALILYFQVAHDPSASDGQKRDARRAGARCVEGLGGQAPARMALKALELVDHGSVDDGLKIAGAAVEAGPDHHSAWGVKGALEIELEMPEAGVESLREALAIEPGCDECRLNLAIGLLRSGRPEESGALFELLDGLSLQRGQAALGLADSLRDQGRYSEAKVVYGQLLETEWEYEALSGLGYSCLESNEWEEGVRWYELAAKHSPSNSDAWHNVGAGCFQIKAYAEAVAAYSIAIDLDPFAIDALISRAEIRVLLGDKGGARRDLLRALEIDPGNKEASVALDDIRS